MPESDQMLEIVMNNLDDVLARSCETNLDTDMGSTMRKTVGTTS